MNFTAAKDRWTLLYSDLQGLFPSPLPIDLVLLRSREQPCTTQDSASLLDQKKADIRNTWSNRKSSRNWIYRHKPKYCSPQGAWEGCCLWRCSYFSAYDVCSCFLHQILLKTIFVKRIQNHRNHRKGQNIKQNPFFTTDWFGVIF